MLLGGMFQLWLLFDENGREIWRRSKEARVYDFCEEEEGWIKWQIWIFQIWVVCFREGKTTRDGKPLFEPMFFFPLFMLRTSCVHEVSNKNHLWGIFCSSFCHKSDIIVLHSFSSFLIFFCFDSDEIGESNYILAAGVSIALCNQASRITIFPLVSITTSFVAEEDTIGRVQ